MAGCNWIEGLEDRRLCSVNASSTFSATLKTGAIFKYNVYSGTKLQGTLTQTVKGSTTFHKIKCTEIDSFTGSGKTAKLISRGYVGVDSKGNYVSYGSVSYQGTSTVTDTNKPTLISYPETLSAGKTYTSTTTVTSVVTSKTVASQTSTFKKTDTVKLLSEKRTTVKVPAGTFSAFELITSNAQSKTTTTIWVVPGKGIVKFQTGSGATAFTEQLAK